MYIPASFEEKNLATLHEFIEQHSFGLLISQVDDQPFATHLPFLLDRNAGANGTLIGHIARANPQWKSFGDQTVLTIFNGPQAYISPTWYEAENLVPTWNYIAVHVYGSVKIVHDETLLLDILQKTVSEYERSMPNPWSFDSSEAYLKPLLGQIVGFQIEIAKIEGKYKLSQNHPMERREKVVAALRTRDTENSQSIAQEMQSRIIR